MSEYRKLLELAQHCFHIKKKFLKMYYSARAGHVGSSLSVGEILTCVKFGWMESSDTLLLSKGHAAAALYATLAQAEEFNEELLETFYQEGTLLAAHPPSGGLPGVPLGTGSLGHGLSLACGIALAEKKLSSSSPSNVFCVLSDGELDAGSTWEAFLFASHQKLSNLICVIDRNSLQGFGRTEEVCQLEPLREKLTSFGWEVAEADGHSLQSLDNAYQSVVDRSKGPSAIIARTVKGRGYGVLEDKVDCHYLPMLDTDYHNLLEFCEKEFKERLSKYGSVWYLKGDAREMLQKGTAMQFSSVRDGKNSDITGDEPPELSKEER